MSVYNPSQILHLTQGVLPDMYVVTYSMCECRASFTLNKVLLHALSCLLRLSRHILYSNYPPILRGISRTFLSTCQESKEHDDFIHVR